jgi:hypothetical protein
MVVAAAAAGDKKIREDPTSSHELALPLTSNPLPLKRRGRKHKRL